MRNQTARLIVEGSKTAAGLSEELGIDKNTVCRWARDYRRENKLPSYYEANGIILLPIKTKGRLR